MRHMVRLSYTLPYLRWKMLSARECKQRRFSPETREAERTGSLPISFRRASSPAVPLTLVPRNPFQTPALQK